MTRTLIDSGQVWIGSIPEHWTLSRLGSVFAERKTTVSDEDYEPLSVSMSGVVPRMENVALTANNDARKLVKAGDYVINSRSDRKGSGGLADRDGSVSVISTVITPRGIDPRFAHHLLRSTAFQEEFYRWGSGIVADLWSTRYAAMSRITLPIPPFPEQQAIADFLDRETAKIDALIEKQQRLVELLRERRRHAIQMSMGTAGGRVPLKRALAGVAQGISPDTSSGESDAAFWVLKSGAPNRGFFDEAESKPVPPSVRIPSGISIRPGDLIVSRASGSPDLVASAAVVGQLSRQLILSDKTFRLEPRVDVSTRYLYWALNAPDARAQIRLATSGADGLANNIPLSSLKRVMIRLPPLSEQVAIAGHLDRETAKIDTLIAKAERFVGLARERRSALITAAVTGQIDVTGRVA